MEYILYICLAIIIVLQIFILLKKEKINTSEISTDLKSSLKLFSDTMSNQQKQVSDIQNTRLAELSSNLGKNQENLQAVVIEMLKSFDSRLSAITSKNDEKLEAIRATMEKNIKQLQDENTRKLDEMRNIVDTKLQETLNDRISKSFNIVSQRLEQVYTGLGEMQTLAAGVGDLKKTLSNVKTRGIFGEIQLSSILSDILSEEQYEANIRVNPESTAVVEFAIKFPGISGDKVYLPIDAKFPLDAYNLLLDAYDTSEQTVINNAVKEFETRIKKFAKDISTKYICVPYTTEFAIMFLPTEGLYAEVLKRGLSEQLQSTYNIIAVGPTNMAALLNSLQMGFKTLAIQKRTSEVWNVLGAVKTEFDKFTSVLKSAQLKLDSASDELDKLVGTRTRQLQRKLDAVTALSEKNDDSQEEE